MPIKELLNFSTGLLIVLFLTNPLHFREAVHRLQFKILKEVTRTDNWGTPGLSVYQNNRHRDRPRRF